MHDCLQLRPGLLPAVQQLCLSCQREIEELTQFLSDLSLSVSATFAPLSCCLAPSESRFFVGSVGSQPMTSAIRVEMEGRTSAGRVLAALGLCLAGLDGGISGGRLA